MTLVLEGPRLLAATEVWVFEGGVVRCGFPQPSAQEFREQIDLNDVLVTDREATFFMEARGSSMVEDNIEDGDGLVVDRSLTPMIGERVVVAVDGEFTLKRLDVRDGKPVLRAMSPNHADIEVSEFTDVTMYGVVTWLMKKMTPRVRAR